MTSPSSSSSSSEQQERRRRINRQRIEEEIGALKSIYEDSSVLLIERIISETLLALKVEYKKSEFEIVFDPSLYPSEEAFVVERLRAPDCFRWDFEREVKEEVKEVGLGNAVGDVFAFEFIERFKEMYDLEEGETNEKREIEESLRRSNSSSVQSSQRSSRATTMTNMGKDHLVSYRGDDDPTQVSLLETELANDVRKRLQSHDVVYYERDRFQAHTLLNVESILEIKIALRLLLNDKKVASASHPRMFAYRIENDNDYNDDGEKGAGASLANVLRLRDAKNVLVVVTRWFGGVHLGSQRFKVINKCASSALELAGCVGFSK